MYSTKNCKINSKSKIEIKSDTPSGGFKAVKEVYSLDVVGQRGVWHQGSVSVDTCNSKFKGEFIHTDGFILPRLKDSPFNQNKEC